MHKYSYRDVCIRIAGEDLDEREMTLEQAVVRVLEKLQVSPGNVDIVAISAHCTTSNLRHLQPELGAL